VVVDEILHAPKYSAPEALLSKVSTSKYSAAMTQIALSAVLESATALMRSGRWDEATRLLEATTPTDPAEAVALAATRAEVAVDQDFAQVRDTADPFLELFEKALTESPDETLHWDLAMLKLRKTYGRALFARAQMDDGGGRDGGSESGEGQGAGESGNGGADGGGAGELGRRLAEQADALREAAPDDARAGHATFYAAMIADNLRALPEEAFAHLTTAFELGERSGDKMVISLALRHLGDHAHTAGDLKLARVHWERSTELRQQIGHLLGALAQQTLLAVLTRDEGNPLGAAAMATEINRWSRQVNLPWITAQTADLSGLPDDQSGGEDD
jgi:tetratricopeptide (TPR) repeat protein